MCYIVRKKLMAVVLGALLLALATPGLAQAQAANVPVYLEGERLAASALEQGGVAYLPMRTIFEALGAEVQWEDDDQRITAALANGSVIYMQVNSLEVRISFADGAGSEFQIENPPFMRRSTVYVPLRFVAEETQYQVEWAGNQVRLTAPKLSWETYTLNQVNGRLEEQTAGYLGTVDLPSIVAPHGWYPLLDFTVERTAAGNYLFQADGSGSGALSFTYNLIAYLPVGRPEAARTCRTHLIMGELPQPFLLDDNIWLSDDEVGVVCINDQTGEVTEYRTADIFQDEYANALCYWTDGRFLLLDNGGWYLYDVQTGQLRDMAAELLTPELKAEVDRLCLGENPSEEERELHEKYYWPYLNWPLPVGNPIPAIWFEGAEGRELHFVLHISYWPQWEPGKTMNIEFKDYPLVYHLPE